METMEFAIDTINRNARTALIRTWLQDKTFRITLEVLLTLSLSRSHKQLSLLFTIQFLWCYDGVGSTNNPVIDIFLHSHHLTGWYCIDIVRRNSVLVTCKSERVKAMKHTYVLDQPSHQHLMIDWRGFNRFEPVWTHHKIKIELNWIIILSKQKLFATSRNYMVDMIWNENLHVKYSFMKT